MTIIAVKPNGSLSLVTAADDVIRLEVETYNNLGSGVNAEIAFFQTESGNFTPENTICRFRLVDSNTDDIIFDVRGNLLNDEENIYSLLTAAMSTGEFSVFNIDVMNTAGFHSAIDQSLATNSLNELQRNSLSVAWASVEPASNIDDLFDIVTNLDNPPDGLFMVLGENTQLFTQALRIAQKLNIPLTVELPPDLDINVGIQIAEDLQAQDHRVRIIWNLTVSRPNGSTSVLGKLKHRFAIGTHMGRIMRRNANTNSNGIPPLHRLCAGYDYPFNWAGIKMRPDVKMDEQLRKKLAKARINTIYRERYKTGVRYILGDCLTQYDLKKGSPLELENSSDISMFIDNSSIELARQDLLKPQSEFIKKIYTSIANFLDKCTDEQNRLLVKSEELGGLYYILQVKARADRPNDAVDLSIGYKPEGATRAVFFNTSVYAR